MTRSGSRQSIFWPNSRPAEEAESQRNVHQCDRQQRGRSQELGRNHQGAGQLTATTMPEVSLTKTATKSGDEGAIRIADVGVTYGIGGDEPVTALENIDLDIPAGSFVSLVGPVRLRQVHAAQGRRRSDEPDNGERHHRRCGSCDATAAGPHWRACFSRPI